MKDAICRHYDKENGWCKKLSDWSEPMPVIVYCPKTPCEHEEELAPCPFCGKKAEMKTSPHIPNGTDYTPRCTDPSCCGRLSKKYSARECAVHHWNMRDYSER